MKEDHILKHFFESLQMGKKKQLRGFQSMGKAIPAQNTLK